jgi:hypothetical protein
MSGVKFFSARPEDFDRGIRTSLVHPNIPLLDAYIGLKSLFGEADRTNIDEAKQQWIFYLRTDGALIEAYDWKRAVWSIGIYEQNQDSAKAERLVQELERQISDASRWQSSQIERLRKAPVGARKLTFKCNYDSPADALFCMKCGTKVENRITKNRSHEHKGAVEIAPRGRRAREARAASHRGKKARSERRRRYASSSSIRSPRPVRSTEFTSSSSHLPHSSRAATTSRPGEPGAARDRANIDQGS